MIRFVAIASLVSLLMLVLYLPAAQPAQNFLMQIRIEHEVAEKSWGREHAFAILKTMLDLQPVAPAAPPLMAPGTAPSKTDTHMQKEVAAVGARLLKNEYFISLNALLLLATYRFAVMLYLLPGIAPFFLAAMVDGLVRRAVKGSDFSGHNPEIFSICACGVIMATCAAVIASVVPVQLPAIVLPALLAALGVFGSVGLANYHKRT
jgi:hypothetical protein